MNVILLENVRHLGAFGEQVKVKTGYARNFLIPTGKAVYATTKNVREFEAKRAEIEKASSDAHQAAEQRAESLAKLGTITITARSGEEGKLFGSIGARDVAEAINAAGHPVKKTEIRLNNGPLRSTGEHEISLQLHADVSATLKILVIGNNG